MPYKKSNSQAINAATGIYAAIKNIVSLQWGKTVKTRKN